MATTTTISVSKANGIRFADINGLLPTFDNQLWCDETWANRPSQKYKQQYYVGDVILLQVKGEQSVAPTITQYFSDGTSAVLTADASTTYASFTIFEYLITTVLGEFYIMAESVESTWKSETVEVIANDGSLLLLQWSNLDAINDSFEFDYSTTLAIANVNFMRIAGQLLTYKPSGEITVYDNQNEKSKIKGSIFRGLTLNTERMPRQLAEIIIIASQHDLFLINQVGYIVEDLPEVEMMGGFVQLSAPLTLASSLGLNTHDIGFDCDSTTTQMIENKLFEDAAGSDSAAVSAGYGLTQIVAKAISGTPTLTVGYTVGGNEIFRTEVITTTPMIDNNRFTPLTDTAWTIYFEVSGGIMDVYFQTIMFNNQP